MDLDTFAWLRSDAGLAVLTAVVELLPEAGTPDEVRLVRAAREIEPDPERSTAALNQALLRRRAATKFGADAARMFFTSDALEQATHPRVAGHRAARLALAVEDGSVLDLGCGLGSDLIATSRAGLVAAGVDVDPLRVALASANLAALDLPGAVTTAEATSVDRSGFSACFVDPARRSARGREFGIEGWTPPWSFVLSVLERRGVAKVAPGIPHDVVPSDSEAEWVSLGGEVKEAALWSPDLSTCSRRATVIGAGGLATLTDEDDPGPTETREMCDFLYEPDGAVIRAGLVTAVAAGVDGGLLDPHLAYVTSAQAFATPFARGYQVLEEVPHREKPLRQLLRQRGIGRLTIKKRGVDLSPDKLRKRLALRGSNEATLVLARIGGGVRAWLVRPLP